MAIGWLLPVHVGVAAALRQAFFSIRRLGRGHCRGATVAGNTPGQVETVIAWSGGRRLHLLTWGEISEGQRASVEHAASRIAERIVSCPLAPACRTRPIVSEVGGAPDRVGAALAQARREVSRARIGMPLAGPRR